MIKSTRNSWFFCVYKSSIPKRNDEIIGLDIQKYCTDNKETIKDALLELRISKYIKYDSEFKKLIVASVPYTECDEDLR